MTYQLEKQHSKKKYHAIERIKMLIDNDTFNEIGSGMIDYASCSGSSEKAISYDGVITGRGKIRNKPVFVFSQDFTVKGGTLGRRHGAKISRIIQLATAAKAPVIGIYDSGGARIDEGVNALAGCGEMLHSNTLASGIIPQISVVVGPCAGASAYSPAITDFVFMVDNISYMFVTGSDVVKSVTGENCTNQELGGAQIHCGKSGVAHKVFGNEKDCFRAVRDLVELLPSSFDDSQLIKQASYITKQFENTSLIPVESQKAYDMKLLIKEVIDDDSFFEIWDSFAASVVVGFAQLSGITIGIVSNQPLELGGAITYDSSDKAARFIRFCDCFNIPIVTFVDTPGYLPGIDQEHRGIVRHGAKLLFAYSEATVPKITIIVRKAYGGAYIAMGSKHLGADYVYALPTAEIAVMGAEGAVSIFYKKELEKILDDCDKKAFISRRIAEYKADYLNVKIASQEGFVDEIIDQTNMRRRIFDDVVALRGKTVSMTGMKKHRNIPL